MLVSGIPPGKWRECSSTQTNSDAGAYLNSYAQCVGRTQPALQFRTRVQIRRCGRASRTHGLRGRITNGMTGRCAATPGNEFRSVGNYWSERSDWRGARASNHVWAL